MNEGDDGNLLMTSADGDSINIQGHPTGRKRNVFRRLVSRHEESSHFACASLLLAILASITAYLVSVGATLFTNNCQDANIYSLTLICIIVTTLVHVLIEVGVRIKQRWTSRDRAGDISSSGNLPSWWVVVSSGLLLGLAITGLSWANISVPESTNYMSLISLGVMLFTFRRIFSRKLIKFSFEADLAVVCLLLFAFFLQGEVTLFDLHRDSNITADVLSHGASDMDYLFTAVCIVLYGVLGMVIVIWEASLIKQVNPVQLVTYSSLLSAVPLVISVIIRYSVWKAQDIDGSIGLTSTWHCITLAPTSHCEAVAAASGWIYVLAIPGMMWAASTYMWQSQDAVNYLLASSLGFLINSLALASVMDKSGASNFSYNAGSVFSTLALTLAILAILIRNCCQKRRSID